MPEAAGLFSSTLYTELLVHTAVPALRGWRHEDRKFRSALDYRGVKESGTHHLIPQKMSHTMLYSLHFNDVQPDIPRKEGISTKLCFSQHCN